MWGRKTIYLLLILLTSYIALMYEGGVPGVILAIELLLMVKCSVVVSSGRSVVSAIASVCAATRSEAFSISFMFFSRSFLL